jgi:signal transduction histidine kinase
MLIVQRSVVSPIDVATVAVLGLAWLAGLAIRPLQSRAAFQSGIGIVLVASPLLLGNASGGPWMPVTLVGFAVVVGAVFALSRNAALVIVFGVALIQAAVLRIEPVGAAFIEFDLSQIAGPLLTILAGVGLVIAFDEWRRQVVVLDARQEELEAAQQATERQVRLQRAQENVERRIHETVLNTLTGISMGEARADLAQRRARRDLEQLELGVQPLEDTNLSRVIDIALATSGADEIPHNVRISADDVIPGPIATALRDASVEALRNIVRHAQASRIRIEGNAHSTTGTAETTTGTADGTAETTTGIEGSAHSTTGTAETTTGTAETTTGIEGNANSPTGTTEEVNADPAESMIEIRISDDGVGMSAQVVERFGMRSAMRHGMQSVAGRVNVSSESGHGTTVMLRAPRVTDIPAVSKPTEATSLMDDSRMSRLGLLGTNIFLAIFAIPIALALPATPVVLAAIIAFVAGNVALAWMWTPVLRRWLPPLLIGSGAIAFLAPVAAAPGGLSCSVDDSSAWLIAGISGGGALLLLSAYRILWARLAVVTVIGAAALVLSLAFTGACRDFTLLSAIVTITYMAAIAGFLTWIDVRFDAQRVQRMKTWHDIVISQADMVSRQAAVEQWNTLTASTRSLLEGVASGELDPADRAVQAEADTEGSALRARIGRGNVKVGALANLVEGIRPLARSHNCAVEVTQIAPWQRTDPLPSWVGGALGTMIISGDCPRVELIALHDEGFDELLIRCTRSAAESFLSRSMTDDDISVAVESDTDGDTDMISIRRAV